MSLIELTIEGRPKDLGGFSVSRLLPFVKRRMVGPFIFLDHLGPSQFNSGQGIDVRPHPHIGLATVTYLFEGEIEHRDSLGNHQIITPGAVNWMTAGRGIVHSERTRKEERNRPHSLHGLQSWIALPKDKEDCEPAFYHIPAVSLPEIRAEGILCRILAGAAFGHRSPVKVHSPLFYIEAFMEAGSFLHLPLEYGERAVYVIEGKVYVDQASLRDSSLSVFSPGASVTLRASAKSHLVLLGGDPYPEARLIDWNFVSSSPDKIERAKIDWQRGLFPRVPGDDKDFIPLPEGERIDNIS